MKIDVQENVCGSSQWNTNRNVKTDELLVTLNIGDIEEDMQDDYVENAENILHDRMTDDEVRHALDHEIWETTCND